MKKASNIVVRAILLAALQDDNGVSEATYNTFLGYTLIINDDKINEMMSHVHATDGRFYLPDDY